VVDYFATFGEPRRPWIDPDQLKAKFMVLSQEAHPDHSPRSEERQKAQDRYTLLNSAYQTLREPKERLAHLLELETGSRPAAIQSAPGELMNLFLEIGGLCRETDKFLEQKRTVTSPLLQVELFGQTQELTGKLQQLQQEVRKRIHEAEAHLRQLNQEEVGKPDAGGDSRRKRLEDSYRTFSYLSRWSAQLQERVVQLAL
jgi:hypothetical protein